MALTAMKLMHCYSTVSDEFGFNPKQDRLHIMKGLQMVMDEIQAISKLKEAHQ